MKIKVTMTGFIEDPGMVRRFKASQNGATTAEDEELLDRDLGLEIEDLMDDWREDPVVIAHFELVED